MERVTHIIKYSLTVKIVVLLFSDEATRCLDVESKHHLTAWLQWQLCLDILLTPTKHFIG